MVVTEANTMQNKAERKVTFCITVDVYYPKPEHYPPSPESSSPQGPSPSSSLEGKCVFLVANLLHAWKLYFFLHACFSSF